MLSRSLPAWATACGLIAVSHASPLFTSRQAANSTNSSMAYGFESVPKSKELTWVPCWDDFQCANLVVPLDYEDNAAGETVIAWIMHPSENPDAEDILYNPGGPGGSGTQYLRVLTKEFNTYLGNQSYNYVSFDPRGVNQSGPSLDCFPDNPAVRDFYDSQVLETVIPGNNASLAESFSRAEGFGKWCSNTHKDGEAAYANTPAVAADMLHFAKLRAGNSSTDDVKVNYWGTSYGTVLGTTFATLYPENVGKFIIDGVVDGDDYYGGLWADNLLQTDECVESFFDNCYDAKSDCSFYKNDSSPADIKKRFDAIIADLTKNPISVSDPETVDFPVVVTVGQLKQFILTSTYAPIALFPALSDIMAGLEIRDASTLVAENALGMAPEASCNYDFPLYSSNQPKITISCNDANGRYIIDSVDEWSDHVDREVQLSAYTGDVWASTNSLFCRAYDLRPPKSQVFNGFVNGTKTATPMLFVRTRHDPVTPAAEKMAGFFEGAGLFMVDAVGHGFTSAESECAVQTVRAYLEKGEMPEQGTVCDVQSKP
ncbi:alpha/beta-hydrolase, partial [Polyplosphaeria fusca]